jgi:hypothetical protein
MKSFLQGKKNLDAAPLRPPGATCRTHVSAAQASGGPLSVTTAGGSNAHVEVVKEGGKVVRLVVICTCGERVEIECLYSAGS